MITRRTFIKQAIAVAGLSALPVPGALAKPHPDYYEPLALLAERIPEEYLNSISSLERWRILQNIACGIKRDRFHRKARNVSDSVPPEMQDIVSDIKGQQNVESPCTIYYGDPHGHSRHSDGMRSANGYYTYAENIGLDFAVLTDHAEILSPAEWLLNQIATDDHYYPGWFVTLQAYEHTNCVDGNYDIYMLTEPYQEIDYNLLYAWFNFFVWRPHEYTNENVMDQPDKVFGHLKLAKKLGIFTDVMAVPHHCSWALAPTNWKYYDPELVFFAEGYSKHGNSIFPSWFEDFFDKMADHLPGCSVLDALNTGKRVGITAATDTHGGMPGSIHRKLKNAPMFNFTGGLTGALIKNDELFDRQSLWNAFKQRNIFGTRVYGLQMSFRVGDREMGSTIYPDSEPTFHIEVFAPEYELIEGLSPMVNYIEVIKNGAIVFKEWHVKDRFHIVRSWTDTDFNDRIDNTYFLRVVGYMGDLGWSSPIFIEKTV